MSAYYTVTASRNRADIDCCALEVVRLNLVVDIVAYAIFVELLRKDTAAVLVPVIPGCVTVDVRSAPSPVKPVKTIVILGDQVDAFISEHL